MVFKTRAPATVRILDTVNTLSLVSITDHSVQTTFVLDGTVRLAVVVPAANFILSTFGISGTLDTPALFIGVTPPVKLADRSLLDTVGSGVTCLVGAGVGIGVTISSTPAIVVLSLGSTLLALTQVVDFVGDHTSRRPRAVGIARASRLAGSGFITHHTITTIGRGVALRAEA